MLDKVIILNKHKAHLIFNNRSPVEISSDVDVIPLLCWFMGWKGAHIVTDILGRVIGVELRRDCSDEITMKIELKKAA